MDSEFFSLKNLILGVNRRSVLSTFGLGLNEEG